MTRYFANRIEGFVDREALSKELASVMPLCLNMIEHHYGNAEEKSGAIYAGVGGVAYMYFHLSEVFQDETYKEKALFWCERALERHFRSNCISFLQSRSGVLALKSLLTGHLQEGVLCGEPCDSFEVLEGWAGYLYTLHFLKRKFKIDLESVANHIKMNENKWAWHGKEYLGAAHGIVGIKYMLEEDFDVSTLNKENLPNSIGGRNDLVQWCHGAPGALASGICPDPWIETTWKYGLLKKGIGLCHGISGNAFSLLSVGEIEKGLHFTEFALQNLENLLLVPDRPFSLYEGLAGATCLFASVLCYLRTAKTEVFSFPAYGLCLSECANLQ